MAEKTELLVVVSLVIVVIFVMFFSLITLAGSVQTLYGSNYYLMEIVAATLNGYLSIGESIMAAAALSMSFSVLGPPLSWGMSILSLFNSNWWLNGWMQWYLFLNLIESLL